MSNTLPANSNEGESSEPFATAELEVLQRASRILRTGNYYQPEASFNRIQTPELIYLAESIGRLTLLAAEHVDESIDRKASPKTHLSGVRATYLGSLGKPKISFRDIDEEVFSMIGDAVNLTANNIAASTEDPEIHEIVGQNDRFGLRQGFYSLIFPSLGDSRYGRIGEVFMPNIMLDSYKAKKSPQTEYDKQKRGNRMTNIELLAEAYITDVLRAVEITPKVYKSQSKILDSARLIATEDLERVVGQAESQQELKVAYNLYRNFPLEFIETYLT